MNILNSVKSFLQFPTKNRKVETSITTSTIMTQKVDIQLEGRSLVSRYQPFALSLYCCHHNDNLSIRSKSNILI